MSQPLQIGLLLPTRGALLGEDPQAGIRALASTAERVEAAGWDAVWVGDSLTAKPRLDPLITLAAIASRTQRVRLGTSVLLGALYHPVLLARAAASVDLLSEGRLILAMGVGGAFNDPQRQEWAAAGVDPQRRANRLEELAQVLPQLWSGEPVTFTGKDFDLRDVTLLPRPYQEPGIPLWLTCHHHTGSGAQVRRAGRWANGIMSITDSPQQYREVWERVAAAALDAGRDPATLDRAFYMTVNLNPDEATARQEADGFIRSYYGANWWGDRWGPFGHPNAVIERARAYAEAGAGHLIVRFAAYDQASQLDRFERDVLPALRAG
ncbi:MAG: LLM class flavin-dependent oxidoreductase [Dehalococcoidia bacterium]|nr:LLM class flavin-dependent oxidoreductase [Dehalococcoidia bacterium]